MLRPSETSLFPRFAAGPVRFNVSRSVTSTGRVFDVITPIGDDGTSGLHILAVSVCHNKKGGVVGEKQPVSIFMNYNLHASSANGYSLM
ncbi:hypothetical protein D3C80_1937570 [compost metagenome]